MGRHCLLNKYAAKLVGGVAGRQARAGGRMADSLFFSAVADCFPEDQPDPLRGVVSRGKSKGCHSLCVVHEQIDRGRRG